MVSFPCSKYIFSREFNLWILGMHGGNRRKKLGQEIGEVQTQEYYHLTIYRIYQVFWLKEWYFLSKFVI